MWRAARMRCGGDVQWLWARARAWAWARTGAREDSGEAWKEDPEAIRKEELFVDAGAAVPLPIGLRVVCKVDSREARGPDEMAITAVVTATAATGKQPPVGVDG